MEIQLEKQPKKYLSSLDAPTREKLEGALRGICDLKGDIVKLSGTKDLFRCKIEHYRIIHQIQEVQIMDREEFEKKIAALPTEAPDAIDLAMLKEAESVNDGSLVSLEDYKRSLEGCSGRLVLRIPRSLHRDLKEQAAAEGVSLNQYMLYKLSK